MSGNEIIETMFHGAASYDENFDPTCTGPRNFVLTNPDRVVIDVCSH
ncbi:hypothetical protein [Lentzea sp. NPDC055074]